MSTKLKNLLDVWSFPNRTEERTQVTLRISYDLYCRLHALKSVYPERSVNDIICDLLQSSTEELIELLPSYVYTQNDRDNDISNGHPEEILSDVGSIYGPSVAYKFAYRRLLESKDKETSANE